MSTLGYNITIVLFWLSTMSWLVWTKVLPPLLIGTPPTMASMVDRGKAAHIGWDLFWDGQPVGEATTDTYAVDDGVVEIKTLVQFRNLPLVKLSPFRLKSLSSLLGIEDRLVSMQAEAKFDIDPLGRLIAFESTFGRGLLPDPVVMLGTVDGSQLRVNVRSGDFGYTTSIYLPPDRPVGDTFSPQARLPGLRLGQSWTEPVYSPFSPPNQPMELLRAEVVRNEYLVWDGEIRPTLLVVYRNESDHRQGAEGIRGRTWILKDGTVVQQEARFGSSNLQFVRRAERARDTAKRPHGEPPQAPVRVPVSAP